MAAIQPPPTYAEVVVIDERTNKARFNPIWLKWFIDLAGFVDESGGPSGVVHNDTGSLQGGTANQYYHLTAAQNALVGTITAATWTPTLTNVANLGASTPYLSTYLRAGGFVIGFGKVDVDPTAPAALTQLGISLPVASAFANNFECAGVAFASGIAGQGAAILADATNDRAEMNWISTDVTNQPMFFIFGYRII